MPLEASSTIFVPAERIRVKGRARPCFQERTQRPPSRTRIEEAAMGESPLPECSGDRVRLFLAEHGDLRSPRSIRSAATAGCVLSAPLAYGDRGRGARVSQRRGASSCSTWRGTGPSFRMCTAREGLRRSTERTSAREEAPLLAVLGAEQVPPPRGLGVGMTGGERGRERGRAEGAPSLPPFKKNAPSSRTTERSEGVRDLSRAKDCQKKSCSSGNVFAEQVPLSSLRSSIGMTGLMGSNFSNSRVLSTPLDKMAYL
jgi:hypothetical protein